MRDPFAIWHPSPNFGERREGALPDMIVLHYTAMEQTCDARDWLCNDTAEVSAHYLISTTGDVIQMVDEAMRAWHAGAGQWGKVSDVNSRSIGIEITNTGKHPFSEPQMNALEGLMTRIMQRWGIAAHRVIGHSDMAPGRKIDPGPRFDWRRLARAGLSIWPETLSESGAGGVGRDWQEDARRFGYACEVVGAEHESPDQVILDAFRSRFRPFATGPIAQEDTQMLADLARRFPAA